MNCLSRLLRVRLDRAPRTEPVDRERVIERIRRVNCKHCEAGVTLVYDPADAEYRHDVEVVLTDPLGVPVRARYRAWCTGSWAVDYYKMSGRVPSPPSRV